MCQTPVIVSVATEVEASCAAVWEVIANIEFAHSVITPVVSVERISEGDGFQVGTRWKEVREYKGSKITQVKTVTSLRKEEGGYSVAINVNYPGDEYIDFTNTSTLEIRPLTGEKEKCLLIGSFGVMPGTLRGRIYFFFCGRRIAKYGQESYLHELDEIGKAAVKQSNAPSHEQ